MLRLKRTLISLAAAAALYSGSLCAGDIIIPDIGTAGSAGMTVPAEKQYGEFFMRLVRASGMSYDPVLNEFISTVGHKLTIHAKDVKFPFEFFLSSDTSLNASAFLGGKVQVNAGLFHYVKNEDEFASVLAHEIAHITQRHLARQIEDNSANTPLSVGAIIAAAALSIINPSIGFAALTTTTGMIAQHGINFTRTAEYEADRIGISILSESGYNPMAMSDLFRTLMQKQGNVNPAYAMLIDHPLSEVRVAEAHDRAAKLPKRPYSKDPNFMFAKARVDVRYMGLDLPSLYKRLKNTTDVNSLYKNYAMALICFEQGNTAGAKEHLKALNEYSKNDFILDLYTDIDISEGNADAAVSRLENIYRLKPKDSAIALNLANACIEDGRYKKAVSVLSEYIKTAPNDAFAYKMLSEAYDKAHDRCNAFQALAWNKLLCADFKLATSYLTDALRTCTDDDREIVRAKFRVVSRTQSFHDSVKSGK